MNLKNKTIYLSPYNNITLALKEKLDIDIKGYIDNYKTGSDIYKSNEVDDYDYIIINSPNYWYEISNNLDKNKVILSKNTTLISYNDYFNQLNKQKFNCDVIFYPHNNAHILDMIPIINKLRNSGKEVMILETSLNQQLLKKHNLKSISIDYLYFNLIKYKSFICFNDWDSIAKKIVTLSNQRKIKTIGIVEGITDFEDIDYVKFRNVYQNVSYVLLTGKNDKKYLKNKQTYIIGIPKLKHLLNQKISFPKKQLVVINLSFVALTYNDESFRWLCDVISVCKQLRLSYVISQHPSDKTILKPYHKISNKTIYEAIKNGSIVISRFSTVLLESVALGKPAVYYKPKSEKIKLYDNVFGAFGKAINKRELKHQILNELNNKKNVRQRAKKFLDFQCNICEKKPPESLAAKAIENILDLQ